MNQCVEPTQVQGECIREIHLTLLCSKEDVSTFPCKAGVRVNWSPSMEFHLTSQLICNVIILSYCLTFLLQISIAETWSLFFLIFFQIPAEGLYPCDKERTHPTQQQQSQRLDKWLHATRKSQFLKHHYKHLWPLITYKWRVLAPNVDAVRHNSHLWLTLTEEQGHNMQTSKWMGQENTIVMHRSD